MNPAIFPMNGARPPDWNTMSLRDKIAWLKKLKQTDSWDFDDEDELAELEKQLLREKYDGFDVEESSKGTSDYLKGGKQKDRDGYLLSKPKEFVNYFHRRIKPTLGRNATNDEIDEFEKDWIRDGKPKVK